MRTSKIGVKGDMGVTTPSELIGTLFHAVALDFCLESCRRKPIYPQIYVSRRISATLFLKYGNFFIFIKEKKTKVLAAPGLRRWVLDGSRLDGKTLSAQNRDG